jgi:branched-chain amino acid transport system permease protein
MNEFFTSLLDGLGVGAVYAMLALGFAFIYRTTASFNFAQGQFLTIGSLLAYSFYMGLGLPALVAVILVMIVSALIGVGVERIAIFPLARRGDNTITWLISTLGVAEILTGLSERIWGTLPLGVNNFLGPAVTHFPFYGVRVQTPFVIAFVVAVLCTVGIELFQRFTLWGRALRAVGDNRNAVELAGINVVALGMLAFAVGGALAGLGGFVLAPVTYAQADGGFTFAILAFAALAMGGFASHWGALLGGLFVGVVETLAGTYIGLNYQDLVVLGVLIIVLLIKPEGMWNPSARRV